MKTGFIVSAFRLFTYSLSMSFALVGLLIHNWELLAFSTLMNALLGLISNTIEAYTDE